MNWTPDEKSTWKTVPTGSKATVLAGGTYPVFVLAAASCPCIIQKVWSDNKIKCPPRDYDVRAYSDTEPDQFHPEGASLRKKWYSAHYAAAPKPDANKAKVRVLFNTSNSIYS